MRARFVVWALALGALAGCTGKKVEAGTQVMLRVYNEDTALHERMDALRVSFSLREGDKWRVYPVKTFSKQALSWPVDIPIVPGRVSDEGKLFQVVVDTLEGDTVLAQARAITGFVPGSLRVLELWLYTCPGHAQDFVCAEEGCFGDACGVCMPDGSCAANVIDAASLLPFDPSVAPTSKPVPGWVTDVGTVLGGDAGAVQGSDAAAPWDATDDADLGVDGGADGGADEDAGGCTSTLCDSTATCVSDESGERCECRAGFRLASTTCVDIDECQEETHGCSPDATCNNEVGGYTCTCKAGFVDTQGDGTECADGCSAELSGCDPHASCALDNGAPTCRCTGSYTGDGKTCTYTASCADLSCGATSECKLKAGSTTEYECLCLSGYESSGSGCVDIDECARTQAICGDTKDCSNTPGGYTCSCKSGYTQASDGTCENIDDCTSSTGAPGCLNAGVCTDGLNGYTCNCAGTGFSGTRCQTNEDNCSPNPCMNGGSCVDGVNTYTCDCPGGYMGDRCEKAVTRTLTVSTSAAVSGASGSVTGGGINCPGTCSVSVAQGTNVTLKAVPKSGYYFGGWSGGCTGGSLICSVTLTGDVSVKAAFTKANIAFATSTTYQVAQLASNDPSGSGSAEKGGDRLCQLRAAASSNAEVRARDFRSLISYQANSRGADRVAGARGWVRPDGLPVADQFSSISYPALNVFYPPGGLDESGTRITYDLTTGALGNGCVNWTSGAMADYRAGGVPTAGGYGWDSAFGEPCVYAFRLYCFSVDYTATVTAPTRSASAKVAFVTDGKFKPAGSRGIADADALCQSEAKSASLSGTFRALMASASPAATAASRFASSGPWVRMDGVAIGSYADLSASPPTLKASVQVTPTMGYLGNEGTWTGATNATTVPTADISCTPSGGTSWTGGASVKGNTGTVYFTDNRFINNYWSPTCDGSYRVMCLQI